MKALICLSVLSLVTLQFSSSFGQTPKKNDRSAEWEYKQLYSPDDEIINRYAKEGWEFAYAVGGAGDSNSNTVYRVILKRHKSHALFGTQISEDQKPEPPPQISKCKLTLAQAPVIRGLRLGMTSDELFTIFPPNDLEEIDRPEQLKKAELPPNYGYINFQFNLSRATSKDRFTGIHNLNIGLLDRKVIQISANYSNTTQFERMEQLIEILSRQFGLPDFKDWQGYFSNASFGLIDCDGFRIKVFWDYSSFSIELTDQKYEKIVAERRQADHARKREGFKF